MKQLKNLRNKIRRLHLEILKGSFFSILLFIFSFMILVFVFVVVSQKKQLQNLQDQLTIQQSHTERWKMEAERNGIALQDYAIDNKNNQTKLDHIKSILND